MSDGVSDEVSALALLRPAWPAPAGIGAAMSTRAGGVSGGAFSSLNLGVAVGDEPAAVAENRARFSAALGVQPTWLRQVHGVKVMRLHAGGSAGGNTTPAEPADAAWTTDTGVACTVQVADCLPVLFTLRDGSAVAAAHAGWRGLAAGVLEATVRALCEGRGARPADIVAWLGPCIGPREFEVGAEVLQAFGEDPAAPDPRRFVYRARPDGAARWLANLPELARGRLATAGLQHISLAGLCTVEETSRFFSFRRDGVTGRLAAAVWRV